MVKLPLIMQDVKLIPAGPNDIARISELATIIWNQHYPSIISRGQIDYMLSMMYSAQSLAEQFEKKGHIFYLINAGEVNLGFLSVHEEKKEEWFLHKFYIDQAKATKGIGTVAFEQLKQLLNPNKIILTVNRQNYRSVNFYFKLGFKIESVADFDIGNNFVMNDFVMAWEKK